MTGRTNAVSGIQLPELSTPATAGNIQSGYQAIDSEGQIITGTAEVKESCNVQIIYAYEAYQSIFYLKANGEVGRVQLNGSTEASFVMLKGGVLAVCYQYGRASSQQGPNQYSGATEAISYSGGAFSDVVLTDFFEISGDTVLNITN